MQLTFLQAEEPLTKKYTKREDGGYDSESYPMLFRVTSHVEDVETIDDFAAALRKHAELGHCLHTGSLDRRLENESRKGHHDKDEERAWIVLDLDGLKNFTSVESFIAALPESFHDTSYIVQHSPSSGIKPGIRAHVFFMLDRPEHMADIKNWAIQTNLVTEKLRDEVTLTAKDFALSYPLDKIANDNGRVVYITAPECVGFEDPVSERISVVRKDNDLLRHNFRGNVADVKKLERDHIDKLRADKGLKKHRHKTYYDVDKNGNEYLKRDLTEPGRVRPVAKDTDNIMRCNLDDGDSEAYFYYINAPRLLRNHKGEPNLLMEKLDPKYFKEVAMPAARDKWEEGKLAFCFRNRDDDRWYVGSRVGNEIIDQPHPIGTEAKIEGWYRQTSPGVPAPKADEIDTWEMKFDPELEHQWNPEKRIFNTWRKSEIMSGATYRSLPPPIITRIIGHVTGGPEEYHKFINWLAYIYQNRAKTGTAWILHGVQGTGKGLLIDRILSPILGEDYVVKQQSRNLKAEFNGFLEKALIVNLDEFDLQDAGREYNAVMQALKMWITDKRFNIRRMHTESKQMENFSNFILTTNSQNGMPIPEGDRRFSFGLRQEKKLKITPEEVEAISTELHDFASYLKGYEVDKLLAHTAHENTAKERAAELSLNTTEEFASAIAKGDIQFFIDIADQDNHDDFATAGNAKRTIKKWVDDAKQDEVTKSSVPELLDFYKLWTGNSKTTVAKLRKIFEHKQLYAKRIRLPDGKRPWGYEIEWRLSDEDRAGLGAHLKAVPDTSPEEKLKAQLDRDKMET